MAGTYTTPLIYCNVKAVFTNTLPVDAYRGAGRPEATYQLERVIDKAAELRQRGVVGLDRETERRITGDSGRNRKTSAWSTWAMSAHIARSIGNFLRIVT